MTGTYDHNLQLSKDYQEIEQAILYIEDHYQNQPSLKEIADAIGYSEYHFQRVFSRWVGISPKRFLQFLTKEYAKELLEQSENVFNTAYQTGLSGSGRLHDLFITCEAVTPGEYKARGEGLTIYYGFHPSPFGECMLAITERGICDLAFIQESDHMRTVDYLEKRWEQATIIKDPMQTAKILSSIFSSSNEIAPVPLHLYLSGTNFQIKVWEALLRIPSGNLVTYSDIAKYIGKPKASRAVGSAVGNNPISVIIPCHRVIQKMGIFGNYRWGSARKKAILGWEMAQKTS